MLKVAIAGFGKMGRIRARELLKRSDVEIIGVFEQSNLEADAVVDETLLVENFNDLLNLQPDAMFICAFNNVACEYTCKAISAGIHVFCEKPPAMSCEELEQVRKALETTPVTLKYGFNHRYHYSVLEAKKLIEDGKLGDLLWIRGVYGKAGSIDYHQNWRNFKKYSGGGILMDQGIHMLDLFHHLSGKCFDVESALLTKSFWDVEVEDNAIISLKSNNVIATMHSSATQWRHKFLIEMCFSNGYLNLDGILSESRSYTPETLTWGLREFEDITFAMGKPAEHCVWFENDDSWKLEIDEFINAILSNSTIENGTFADAHKVLSLIEGIYQASEFYN